MQIKGGFFVEQLSGRRKNELTHIIQTRRFTGFVQDVDFIKFHNFVESDSKTH